ncbi:MAG: SsrA-binding protein SmpB [Bacteroidetes bacterium]|nr:SsrA-binding protein SmpB [Bacteroidota bacterium]
MDASKINIKNKRAEFDFEIIDRFDAGIMLTGSEIKSIRDGGGTIAESFCYMRDGQVYIKNMNIPEYSHGTYANHEPARLRKLLLTKRELNKIETKMKERGYTLIPLRVFISDRGLAKIQIGLGRGKKKFDKRESLQKKDVKRDIDRALKKYK